MVLEEDIEISTTPKNLSYREPESKGGGGNKLISTHPPQECVEAKNKITTRQDNQF